MNDERKLRKELKGLTDYVQAFVTLLDDEMKKASSPDRGRRIADLSNKLELKNNMVRRFVLSLDWNGKPLKRSA